MEEQRVEIDRPALGDRARGVIGEFVRLADDEAVERIARLQCNAECRRLTHGRRGGQGLLQLGRDCGPETILDNDADVLDGRRLRCPKQPQPLGEVIANPVRRKVCG